MPGRFPPYPIRRASMSKPFKCAVAGLSVFALLVLTASAQIGGTSWAPEPLSFNVQWPYNTNEDLRYFVTNEPLPTYHCLVYSNDAPFSEGSTTLPRTEQRFNPDY